MHLCLKGFSVMSCIQNSLDCQIDVVCLGFLFAIGFRLFDYLVWLCKDISNIVKEMFSDFKSRHPKD